MDVLGQVLGPTREATPRLVDYRAERDSFALNVPERVNAAVNIVDSWEKTAQTRYHWAKALSMEVDDCYPRVAEWSVDAVISGQRVRDETFERIEISFEAWKLVGNLRHLRDQLAQGKS